MKIAFDVDDTLIILPIVDGEVAIPNYKSIGLYKWFQDAGFDMVIWSGGGIDYACRWGERLGLQPFEAREKKKSDDIDIAFDDCAVDLAKVNIRISRNL